MAKYARDALHRSLATSKSLTWPPNGPRNRAPEAPPTACWMDSRKRLDKKASLPLNEKVTTPIREALQSLDHEPWPDDRPPVFMEVVERVLVRRRVYVDGHHQRFADERVEALEHDVGETLSQMPLMFERSLKLSYPAITVREINLITTGAVLAVDALALF